MEKIMMMQVLLKRNGDMIVAKSELHDGTEFSFTVNEHDIKPNDILLDEEVPGFVQVTQMSLQDTRAYIRLPNPNIIYGRNVLINKYKLQPPSITINDFIDVK